MRILALAIVAIVLAACGGDSTKPAAPPTVTGTWTGVSVGALPYRLTLDLLESGGTVTGTGLLDSWVVTSSGTFVNPTASVTITFTSGTVRTVSLRGTLSGNTITGELNGDIFRANAIALTRQPR